MTITALVFGVINDSNFVSSMVISIGETISQKTGSAPTYLTAFTVATNVREGTITSSPFPIPKAHKAKCNAAVQFETAHA
jgi:hypothetical protein